MEILIPADDPVRLLSAFVEGMELSDLYQTYGKIKKNQATPRQLFKIMVYASMNRIYSSRDIETACRRDINFMYLLEGSPAPDHATFDFKLVDVVPNDSQKRIAMTEEQQEIWMGFIREDKTYTKYYDEFVVLLGTGMRVSEFCGLTKSDLDFENRRIGVDHQLVRERGGKYYVEKTKTECGCRFNSHDRGSLSKSEEYS